MRRDLLLYYCLHAPELHEAGAETETLAALEKATEFREVLDADIARLPQERKRVVREVARVTRSASFREPHRPITGRSTVVSSFWTRTCP